MNKIINFFKPWYWAVLKVYIVLIVLIIVIHLNMIISIYLEPVEVPAELRYKAALGLFAPIFYGFEAGLNAMSPVLHFATFVVIIIESCLLFTLSFMMVFILMKKRWILFLFVPLTIIMGLMLADEGNNLLMAIIYLFIVITSVITWFKNSEKHI